jgi:hypothetical protein
VKPPPPGPPGVPPKIGATAWLPAPGAEYPPPATPLVTLPAGPLEGLVPDGSA